MRRAGTHLEKVNSEMERSETHEAELVEEERHALTARATQLRAEPDQRVLEIIWR